MTRPLRSAFLLSAILLAALVGSAAAEDSTEFRGSAANGQSSETNLPTEWSQTKNLQWRTELPGPGGSSPTLIGERIYLTCYTGYGLRPSEGSDKNLMRHVLCLDRDSGAILWTKDFKPKLPESNYKGGTSARHGYSTSTIATDGEGLYVFFGKSGVYRLDMDGNTKWHVEVGDGTHSWGSGASPRLYNNLVIINASVESRTLRALDKETGEEVWKVDGIRGAWNTPTIVKGDNGDELVMSLPRKMISFDPATGKELWTCEGIPDGGYTCPSVLADNGIVYVIGGRQNTAIAIRTGGRGDVSDSHELWRVNYGSNVTSPVLHEGHLYWAHEAGGIANCLDAETGEVKYRERLQPRPGLIYASPLLADGKIYYQSHNKGVYVVAAKPEFELLAHNTSDDEERSNANPVADKSRLLVRTDGYLHCYAK